MNAKQADKDQAENSPANSRQVGGDHYRGAVLQHWDLAVMYGWDPFQYQITKYVMRWKDKYKGNPQAQLEELQKAAHFLQKYIEVYRSYLPPLTPAMPIELTSRQLEEAQKTLARMELDYEHVGIHGDGTHLIRCRSCHEEMRGMSLPHVVENHERNGCPAKPSGEYVQQ